MMEHQARLVQRRHAVEHGSGGGLGRVIAIRAEEAGGWRRCGPPAPTTLGAVHLLGDYYPGRGRVRPGAQVTDAWSAWRACPNVGVVVVNNVERW